MWHTLRKLDIFRKPINTELPVNMQDVNLINQHFVTIDKLQQTSSMQNLLYKYNEVYYKKLKFRFYEVDKNKILSSLNLLISNAVESHRICLKIIHIWSNLQIHIYSNLQNYIFTKYVIRDIEISA